MSHTRNLASGLPERTLKGHDGWVAAVAVTLDGQRIISASHDKTVRVWNLGVCVSFVGSKINLPVG